MPMQTDITSATIRSLRESFTVAEDQRDHLLRCWIRSTSCDRCLEAEGCSWCPFTWSCVPNSHKIQFLAPAHEEQICPAKSEQWELRTQPLGCNVSSITTVTGIVSIAGTLLLILLISLTVLAGLRVRRYARERQVWRPVWVRQWRAEVAGGVRPDRETEPLLAQR